MRFFFTERKEEEEKEKSMIDDLAAHSLSRIPRKQGKIPLKQKEAKKIGMKRGWGVMMLQ